MIRPSWDLVLQLLDALSSLSPRITSTTLSENLVGLSSPRSPHPGFSCPKQHVIDRISPKAPNPSLSPKSVHIRYTCPFGDEKDSRTYRCEPRTEATLSERYAYQSRRPSWDRPAQSTVPVTFSLGRCANRTRTRSSPVHSTIPRCSKGHYLPLSSRVRSPSIPDLHDFVHLRGCCPFSARKKKFVVVQVTEHLCVLEHRAAGTLTTAPCGLLMGTSVGGYRRLAPVPVAAATD